MKFDNICCLQLALAVLSVAVTVGAISVDRVIRKRQVGSPSGLVDSSDDHVAEASGFGAGAVQGHSKYFQYTHVPHKDHYETGHKRGNDHHFIERHEKAHPHAGEFKTKVRWGDKHGGYGEHYWDYNHGGHGHGDASDEGSEAVADYQEYDDQNRKKRHPAPSKISLLMDPETQEVYDQVSGRKYYLQPIY